MPWARKPNRLTQINGLDYRLENNLIEIKPNKNNTFKESSLMSSFFSYIHSTFQTAPYIKNNAAELIFEPVSRHLRF